MVKVNDVYYDENLLGNLNILKKNIKSDWDFWFIIDGLEGTGKSTFAQQLAFLLDEKFSIKNIVFTPKQFEEAVENLEKYQCIVWDEAITGTQSVDMTRQARTLQKMAVQMRQKNLFIILVLHSYFEMKKYYAIHRTWFLLHCYYRPNYEAETFERGFFEYYGRDAKRLMYCNDKFRKNYEYRFKPEFRGRFTKKYMVDEQEYKSKKAHISETEEGITDKEFILGAFSRGFEVKELLPKLNLTKQYVYELKRKFDDGVSN